MPTHVIAHLKREKSRSAFRKYNCTRKEMPYEEEMFRVSWVRKDVVPDGSAKCIAMDEDQGWFPRVADSVRVDLTSVG